MTSFSVALSGVGGSVLLRVVTSVRKTRGVQSAPKGPASGHFRLLAWRWVIRRGGGGGRVLTRSGSKAAEGFEGAEARTGRPGRDLREEEFDVCGRGCALGNDLQCAIPPLLLSISTVLQ